MFVVTLTYHVPLETVDAHLPAHVEYLKKQYAGGVFLASGRKVPRDGGVILARAESREALEAVLAEDPFARNDLARYDIVEFVPTMTSEELAFLREQP